MADKMVECSEAELRAAFRAAEADAVRKFLDGTGAEVRGQTNYYSTVRFQLVATGVAPGPYTVTLDPRERQAFGYAQGGSPLVAGFVQPTGVGGYTASATLAQTNLSEPKKTRNGQRMVITSISAFLQPGSDQVLASYIWQHGYVECVKNDQDRSPLGPLSFFPALSSINGQGTGYNSEPAFNATNDTIQRFRSSEGTRQGYDLKASPIIWTPSGQVDSSLYLAITLDQALTFTATDRVAVPGTINAWSAAAAANSAPLGPSAVVKPPVEGSYCDILFRLDGFTTAAMSQNQGA